MGSLPKIVHKFFLSTSTEVHRKHSKLKKKIRIDLMRNHVRINFVVEIKSFI